MRNVNCNVLSASDNASTNGDKVDANQLVSASFHCFFGDSTAKGVFKLQASNDICNDRYQAANFTPSHWVDIPSQSANIVSGTSALLTIANCTYRWLRAVFTNNAAGVQTITPVADSSGSLNSKYFLISAGNSGTNYYVWFDVGGTGTDPLVPGKTGVHITIAANDSAATIGAAIVTALNGLAGTPFSAAGTTTVTVTNTAAGPFTAASDFNTGFAFAVTTGGTSTVTVNMNALSI